MLHLVQLAQVWNRFWNTQVKEGGRLVVFVDNIDFAAELFQRLGFPRADANRRALLAYSTYLGYTQLVHATPQLLPQTQTARRVYLNDVLAALTSPPS
jgi:hypothetical protein